MSNAITSCIRLTDVTSSFEPDPYIFTNTKSITNLNSSSLSRDTGRSGTGTGSNTIDAASVESASSYWWGVSASAVCIASLTLIWILGVLLSSVYQRRSRTCLSVPACNSRNGTHNNPNVHASANDERSHTSSNQIPHPRMEQEAPLESPTGDSTMPSTMATLPRGATRLLTEACIVVAIVTCILIVYSVGLTNAYRASHSVTDAIHDARALTDRGINLLDTYTKRHDATWNQTRLYLQTTNALCPNLVPQLCSDPSNMETCREDGTVNASSDMTTSDGDSIPVNTIPSFLWNPWYAVMNSTSELLQFSTRLNTTIQQARLGMVNLSRELDTAATTSKSFKRIVHINTIAVTLLLIWTILLFAWEATQRPFWNQAPRFRNLVDWIRRRQPGTTHKASFTLWSIFGILVCLTLILSITSLVAGIVVADGCIDGPDDRVVLLLDKARTADNLNPLFKELLVFYIQGCPSSNVPFISMVEPIRRVAQVSTAVQTLLAVVAPTSALTGGGAQEDGSDGDGLSGLWNNLFGGEEGATSATDVVWQTLCGTDPTLFQEATMAIQDTICTLGDALMDIKDLFACSTFRLVYRQLVYDGICYQSSTGFYYMAIIQWLIVLFAMVLYSIRVALYSSTSLVARDDEWDDRFNTEERNKSDDSVDVLHGTDEHDEPGNDTGPSESGTKSWKDAELPSSNSASSIISAIPSLLEADGTDGKIDSDIIQDSIGAYGGSPASIRSASDVNDQAYCDGKTYDYVQAARSYP